MLLFRRRAIVESRTGVLLCVRCAINDKSARRRTANINKSRLMLSFSSGSLIGSSFSMYGSAARQDNCRASNSVSGSSVSRSDELADGIDSPVPDSMSRLNGDFGVSFFLISDVETLVRIDEIRQCEVMDSRDALNGKRRGQLPAACHPSRPDGRSARPASAHKGTDHWPG